MDRSTAIGAPRRPAGALRALYVYTLVGAGAFGVWLLLAPSSFAAAFGLPAPDRFVLGIVGSVYTAFAIVAAIGLRDPGAVAPAFLVQLVYKVLWLVVVFLPRALAGQAPVYAWIHALVFVSYVALDLVALPLAEIVRGPLRPGPPAASTA